MKQILLFIFTFSISICNAQTERKALTLNLAIDAENYYAAEIPKSPYFVKEKVLQIYPGEKLLIETEIKGDSIYTMKVVSQNTNPERTIEVEFSQNEEDRNRVNSTLKVKNPFGKKLNYNALMFSPVSQTWKRTSIIAIPAKLQNFEMWPHSIITIVLDKWRFE